MAAVKAWVVRKTDPKTLAEIVLRAKEDREAIAEGRVFVGKKRALKDQPVREGDEIRIGPRVVSPEIEVLFDENGIVACIKPAGLPTVPDHAGAAHSLVALVEKQLGTRGRVTSRLDREVSGVVLFATNDRAEARLRAARERGDYHRRYLAIAIPRGDRRPEVGDAGTWTAPIGRAKDPLLRRVNGDDAKPATSRWQVLAVTTSALFLAVEPETGRTHQIRVHAADAGWPLLGDRDYGPGRVTLPNGAVVAPSRIALHAARVRIAGTAIDVEAPFPPELADLWRACGGKPVA